jgi:serine/threonine-protein kinase
MADMAPPEVFSDRYELVRHIARGGMAQVYLAQDQLLDRPVAIKVLFPELSSDLSFVERFRREAQAAANLSHANIVSIYDWGQGEHTYFIVMEYVDGQTLSALIRQGLLSPTRTAAIGADIASALDFAHRRGVIHRDVKPGNVLIDLHGQVKVADFGIARAISHASEGLTQTGAVMGTATYFSPEQAQGLPVDARSDVYSLGVVLYEMVCGRPPFSGDSPVAIAYKHVREYASLPSSLNPSVPGDLEAIVMAAMAKDPEDRYQSAGELRDDLVRFQQGHPVLAAPPVQPSPATRVVGGPPPGPPYAPTYAQREVPGLDALETAYMEYPDEGQAPQHQRSWLWASLFGVLLVSLGVLVFLIGHNVGWWGSPTNITVPANLKGDSVAQAQALLKQAGFGEVTVQHQPTALVPGGQVIGTSPPSGSVVRSGSPIVLDVSAGNPWAAVPYLVGKPCGTADSTLTAKSFHYRNNNQSSSTISSGNVISTKPAGGQKYQQDRTVQVYCSTGVATTIVPLLQGLTESQAIDKLFADHLTVGGVKNVPSATVLPGFVAYTSPVAGSAEPWRTAVTLYVSDGRQMTTVPPDLVGKTQQQASTELNAVDLSPAIVPVAVTNPAQDGYVISTDPSPGKAIREGSSVTLYVGQYTGPPPTTTLPTTTATTLPTTTAPTSSTTTAPTSSTTSSPTTTTPATTTTATTGGV